MRKVNIQYERMDHILAVSSGHANEQLFLKPDFIVSILFSEYIKSQMHLSLQHLFNRSIYVYKKAYEFSKGQIRYEKDALKVLDYFYEDMAGFLINNPYNVKVELIVDVNFQRCKIIQVDYRKVYNSLLDLTKVQPEGFDTALRFVVDHPEYNNIIDCVDRVQSITEKPDSYAVWDILTKRKPNSILKWEV